MGRQIVHWKLGELWPAFCSPWPAASNMEHQLYSPKVFNDFADVDSE